MPSTFVDDAALQGLFQESMSPVTNYSQGLLALAMDRRRQAQQVAQEQRQEQSLMRREQAQSALVLAREQQMEKIRQAGETARAEAANKAVLDRWKAEHDILDKEKQEDERKDTIKKANAIGANLPTTATFEEAAKALAERHGRSYIEANKRLGTALAGTLRATGRDPQKVAERVASMVADDPAVAKMMTIQEREDIRNNPQKLVEFRKLFAGQKAKKYEAYVQAVNNASTTIAADLEKEAQSKPEAALAAADMRQAMGVIQALQKEGPVSPEVEATAFDEYSKAARPPAPTQPQRRLPPLPPRGAGTPATQPRPGVVPGAQPNVFEDWFYGTPPAWGGAAPPAPGMNAPTLGPGGASVPFIPTPQAPAPFVQPGITPQPGIPTDPSILSTLRLRKYLQDQATQNNALFPTAFPANDLGTPAAP